MTNQELSNFFHENNIVMLCASCGEPMSFMGEWPAQYHPDGKTKNLNQTLRWLCKTCRMPSPIFEKGFCIGANMIISTEFSKLRYDDASSSDLAAA